MDDAQVKRKLNAARGHIEDAVNSAGKQIDQAQRSATLLMGLSRALIEMLSIPVVQ